MPDHEYMDHTDCTSGEDGGPCHNPTCWMCGETLAMCRVCRQAEVELTPTCPGPPDIECSDKLPDIDIELTSTKATLRFGIKAEWACPDYCDRPKPCPVHGPGTYGNEAGYEDRGT